MSTDTDFLLQHRRQAWFEQVGSELWTTIFSSERSEEVDVTIFAGLLPLADGKRALEYESWDLALGDGFPCCSRSSTSVHYLRFGTGRAEPIVYRRSFHGLKPEYLELSEEFRHFHNLYENRATGEFIKIHRDGSEEVVARITTERVEVRTIPLRRYLAIKEMYLAVFIDSKAFSPVSLDDIPESERVAVVQNETTRYACSVHECEYDDRGRTFSRFVGKKLIAPLPKEQSGVWPYSEDQQKEYEEFNIGTDDEGQPRRHTCDPKYLSNHFVDRGTPHYFTPVFFRRDVLAKYYQQPQKYHVSDGYLACGHLWGVQIDNDHQDYVVVYLGDLGRDVPHDEQVYWRSFNIPPQGTISLTNYRRSFLVEFADATSTDHTFKAAFARFQRDWHRRHGWDLFLPLKAGDTHHLAGLRTPLTSDQAEFDGLVLSLTKILIDSINEVALVEHGAAQVTGSIAKLESFLTNARLPEAAMHIKFLRNLQSLRSAGVSHRKGDKYARVAAAVDIGTKGLPDVFNDLLRSATALLVSLRDQFLSTPEE